MSPNNTMGRKIIQLIITRTFVYKFVEVHNSAITYLISVKLFLDSKNLFLKLRKIKNC